MSLDIKEIYTFFTLQKKRLTEANCYNYQDKVHLIPFCLEC